MRPFGALARLARCAGMPLNCGDVHSAGPFTVTGCLSGPRTVSAAHRLSQSHATLEGSPWGVALSACWAAAPFWCLDT
jgi:hypothetical protein